MEHVGNFLVLIAVVLASLNMDNKVQGLECHVCIHELSDTDGFSNKCANSKMQCNTIRDVGSASVALELASRSQDAGAPNASEMTAALDNHEASTRSRFGDDAKLVCSKAEGIRIDNGPLMIYRSCIAVVADTEVPACVNDGADFEACVCNFDLCNQV